MTQKLSNYYKNKWENLFFIIAATSFVYVLLRAYFVGFTHDEAVTYTILTFRKDWILTANNHWVNTGLSFISAELFGYSEFALRLPNVLAFLVYLYFLYRILKSVSVSFTSLLLSLPILILNPLLIEYFGVCRGYGLAIAFFTGTVFYLLKMVLEGVPDPKKLKLSVLFSVLTIYSNFAFLIPVATFHLCFIILFKNEIVKSFRVFIVYYTSLFFLLLPGIVKILYLKNAGELYFGGDNNIVEDTLYSVLSQSIYFDYNPYQNWILLGLLMFLFLSGIFLLRKEHIKFLFLTFLFLLIVPTFIFYFSGTKFAIERTAIYWVVLFGLQVLFMSKVSEEGATILHKAVLYLPIFILSGSFYFSFITSVNFTTLHSSSSDRNVLQTMKVLEQSLDKTKKYKLGITWYFEPVINYYREVKGMDFIEPVTREGVDGDYDFYFVGEMDFAKIDTTCGKVLHRDLDVNTILLSKCNSK